MHPYTLRVCLRPNIHTYIPTKFLLVCLLTQSGRVLLITYPVRAALLFSSRGAASRVQPADKSGSSAARQG